MLGMPEDSNVRQQLKEKTQKANAVPNLFRKREKLLFREYPHPELAPKRNITIGIPRVLSFWETMPFWVTFFESLGFDVKISDPSTRKI